MREVIAFILIGLVLALLAGLVLYLRRKARHERWLRRGHADYSTVHRRRPGLFG
ncbi:MAG: LPXTG cell wall anchor domain-containing protein [Sphingosinicella sp.]|uniref:LPXTG cell wall anchor domain-containing protein n=1 Tax=Sphingosinicella sp. TaxID=1917971 RepID=UPI0040376D1E